MHRKKPAIDRVFHALGDPTRRAIMEKLSPKAVSVSRLAEPLDITLGAVVQHLQVLEEAGWCKPKTWGGRTCRIEPAELSAAEKWTNDGARCGSAGWIRNREWFDSSQAWPRFTENPVVLLSGVEEKHRRYHPWQRRKHRRSRLIL